MINKYVIWLSEEEYTQLSKKYQMETLSEYELNDRLLRQN